MIVSLLKRAGAVALLLSSLPVFALNDVIIYTFKGGAPAEGLTVKFNGAEEKQTRRDGSVAFDINVGGTHSVQILEGGNSLHSFRFDSAKTQLVDIVVDLTDEPRILVETYFTTETRAARQDAPTGFIQGRVSAAGALVAGARITVQGAGVSTTADDRGRFELELPRGVYQVNVAHPDDDRSQTERMRVVSNVTRGITLELPGTGVAAPSLQMEEVVVLGSFRPGTFEVSERDTSNIVDTLGIEDLARFGDSDVAASVVRIPGVTVQDDRFVFIRGLGGRYVTSTLNDATMPSTDPSKRTVPLDLFPSNIVSQLDIKKTFVASMPGESTGGNLVINTRTFPEERIGKVSASIEATDGVTGKQVFVDPTSGAWDWAGWDAGEREEPVEISAIAEVLALGTVTDPDTGNFFELPDPVVRELQRLGALLLQDDLEEARVLLDRLDVTADDWHDQDLVDRRRLAAREREARAALHRAGR